MKMKSPKRTICCVSCLLFFVACGGEEESPEPAAEAPVVESPVVECGKYGGDVNPGEYNGDVLLSVKAVVTDADEDIATVSATVMGAVLPMEPVEDSDIWTYEHDMAAAQIMRCEGAILTIRAVDEAQHLTALEVPLSE